MNRTSPPSIDERAWQAQERALSGESRDRGDAVLARALRSAPVTEPPPGFAADVLRHVAAAPAVAVDDGRLESLLQRALVAVFAIGALATAVAYGGDWWTLASAAFGGEAVRWGLAAAACLALSWWPGRWLRRDDHTAPSAA